MEEKQSQNSTGMEEQLTEKEEKKNIKPVQVFAMLGVILLVAMVIATLVVAILPLESGERLFKGLLGCDIAIPIILYVYMLIYKYAKQKDAELEKKINSKDEHGESN